MIEALGILDRRDTGGGGVNFQVITVRYSRLAELVARSKPASAASAAVVARLT